MPRWRGAFLHAPRAPEHAAPYTPRRLMPRRRPPRHALFRVRYAVFFMPERPSFYHNAADRTTRREFMFMLFAPFGCFDVRFHARESVAAAPPPLRPRPAFHTALNPPFNAVRQPSVRCLLRPPLCYCLFSSLPDPDTPGMKASRWRYAAKAAYSGAATAIARARTAGRWR